MINRLTAVGEEDVEVAEIQKPQSARQPPQAPSNVAVTGLIIALKALSQRSIIAVASLFNLVLLASAFVLWWQIIEAPSVLQIVTTSIYSLFILVALWMRRT